MVLTRLLTLLRGNTDQVELTGAQKAARAHVVRTVGCVDRRVRTYSDVVNAADVPAEWVPALLALLNEVSEPATLDSCVRILTAPMAKCKAEKPLIQLYDRLGDDERYAFVRWAIGNAIHSLDVAEVGKDVVRIASDRRQGFERQMFVMSLRYVRPLASDGLIRELLKQPDVAFQAMEVVKAWRDPNFASSIAELGRSGANKVIRDRARALAAKLAGRAAEYRVKDDGG